VTVLVAISTELLYWLLDAALPLPAKASIESLTIDALIGWHLWVIAFLFSLVVVFMLYSVVVFRRREGDDGEGVHFEGNTTLEIAWTALPLVLVVIFAYYGIQTLNTITETTPDEVVIRAIGRQWSWSFEYANGVLSEELMLPLNKRVHMELETKDVNHAFWIPEFRVKTDLIAGQINHLNFTPIMSSADYEAEYGRQLLLKCAELCGLSHYQMSAPVKVVPEDEFTAWLGDQLAQQAPTVAQK
jgi:cytochrome c oxidase subunit 2